MLVSLCCCGQSPSPGRGQTEFSHGSGGCKSGVSLTEPQLISGVMYAGHAPSGGSRVAPIPHVFQLLVAPALLGLWPHHSDLHLYHHMVSSSSVPSSLCFSLIRRHMIVFRTHHDNPGYAPPLKSFTLITSFARPRNIYLFPCRISCIGPGIRMWTYHLGVAF